MLGRVIRFQRPDAAGDGGERPARCGDAMVARGVFPVFLSSGLPGTWEGKPVRARSGMELNLDGPIPFCACATEVQAFAAPNGASETTVSREFPVSWP
jgi:hypothetical protein